MPGTGHGATHKLTQQELATIALEVWRRRLKNSHLAADEDFFAAGGDSLLADEVTLEIAAATGIEIPIVTLFISPTVTEFADALMELAESVGADHDGI